jgi:hypothetical protein
MMSESFKWKAYKLGTPATYCVKVNAHLDPGWSERLAGMKITTKKQKDGSSVTTLTGQVRDQAELMGVLNSLYDMHVPILTVEILKDAE